MTRGSAYFGTAATVCALVLLLVLEPSVGDESKSNAEPHGVSGKYHPRSSQPPPHHYDVVEEVTKQGPAVNKAHDDHPKPVYDPPAYKPAKEEPKKEEVKKEESKKDQLKKEEKEIDAKLAEYKGDPYHYYDHDYLKKYHPKYWVKVSDYEVPKVKNPMTKVEEEILKKFVLDRTKSLLSLKHMVPIFKDWKAQEDYEIGAFIDKLAMITVPASFLASLGAILPLWAFNVAQPFTVATGRKFGGSRLAMMWEKARESLPIPTDGVDKLARTVTEAVVAHEECGQRLICEAGQMVGSWPRPISRMAK